MERKRTKVHMLPTEGGVIFKNRATGTLVSSMPNVARKLYPAQHLYFTLSDEEIKRNPSINEIKEGDWVLWFWDGGQIGVTAPQQYLGGEQVLNSGHRKIIASTDPKLIHSSEIVDYKGLPYPTQAFIKAYCEQGGIDEVDVEYWNKETLIEGMIDREYNLSLKVDPIHNTITTHRIVEKMYSREEAVENVYDLLAERLGLKELETPRNTWVNSEGQKFRLTAYGFKWIEENLLS